MNTDVVTDCPDCDGPRMEPQEARTVAVFDHHDGCDLAAAEVAGHHEDRARRDRYGTQTRHRPVTDAERRLLAASGVLLPRRAPVFARVEWVGPLRTRTWTGADLTACDALVGAS